MHSDVWVKKKTGDEVRVRDWSSDVCSAELEAREHRVIFAARCHELLASGDRQLFERFDAIGGEPGCSQRDPSRPRLRLGHQRGVGRWFEPARPPAARSDERRVGKACVSTCISRYVPRPYKNTTIATR